jgi:creatinase
MHMTHDMFHVMEWHNGDKAWAPFSQAEMGRRQEAVRAWMAGNDVDAAFFTSGPAITHLSGWLCRDVGRNRGLVLTRTDGSTISAAIEGGRGWRQSLGGNLSYTDWRRDNYWRAVRQLTAGVRRLALEFDTVSLDFRRLLDAALPGVEMVDIAPFVRAMRRVKSCEEIALIRKGAMICDLGARAAVACIRPGVAEYQVAHAATEAMNLALAEAFPRVELPGGGAALQSGINTDGAQGSSTNKRILAGEILSLTCTLPLFGQVARLQRTLFCGKIDGAHLDIWHKNAAIHRRGLELIRPGAACAEIGEVLNDMYRSFGLIKRRSARVLSHHDGREDLGPELLPGMVVALEPMVMLPEGEPGAGGYRELDMVVVTEDGAEVLSALPFGPDHTFIG